MLLGTELTAEFLVVIGLPLPSYFWKLDPIIVYVSSCVWIVLGCPHHHIKYIYHLNHCLNYPSELSVSEAFNHMINLQAIGTSVN